ncbi:hypothetical protein EGR_02757 [Echinococcus granulosus]|uniref:Uncharacterized protein n=1 Tax=Echinococcus granulosus TaxID=6210 RepID=W6V779_ECHGR|nr:hypothetical protein EGR_02757 [Echinococcus granulosus]EUB62304.1 hypothetical protein EGR_02757 [Echinococcus granulosus]
MLLLLTCQRKERGMKCFPAECALGWWRSTQGGEVLLLDLSSIFVADFYLLAGVYGKKWIISSRSITSDWVYRGETPDLPILIKFVYSLIALRWHLILNEFYIEIFAINLIFTW